MTRRTLGYAIQEAVGGLLNFVPLKRNGKPAVRRRAPRVPMAIGWVPASKGGPIARKARRPLFPILADALTTQGHRMASKRVYRSRQAFRQVLEAAGAAELAGEV